MPQTQSPTTQGYGEIGKLIAGETATAVTKVVGIKTSCTASEAQNYAGITKCTESGLTEVAADTVVSSQTTVANDTVELDHVFTAGEAVTVKGFGVTNNDGDVLFAICCFAADVPLQTSDTRTVEMKMQFKLGAA